jgi:hypothetical protein
VAVEPQEKARVNLPLWTGLFLSKNPAARRINFKCDFKVFVEELE